MGRPKNGGGEGESKAGKRKRPGGVRGSAGVVWGNSLAWKNVTPNDPLSVLVGSDEGGFMSLEEIDGDIFVGGAEDGGNLLGANPEEPKKPKEKKRKKTGKEVVKAKAIDSSNHVESPSSMPKQGEAADVSTPGPSSQSDPSAKLNQKKKKNNKKKQKEKKPKVVKNAVPSTPVEIEASLTLADSPILGVIQTKKKSAKGERKPSFVVGPVISAVAGDIEGNAAKDVKEEVSEVEAVNDNKPSEKSTSQKKGRPQDAKEVVPEVEALKSKDGTQKKVKLGSKARRLLKLQKQQGQKGVDKKQNHTTGKDISEEDLRKCEDMEIERLEKLPAIDDVEVEEIDMSAWA